MTMQSDPLRLRSNLSLNSLAKRAVHALLLYGMLAFPAAALDRDEADKVVAILEGLAASSGETVYYDEFAADEWFDRDESESGLIAAAGFERETWRTVYDQTLKGLIATIPQAEIDKSFGNLNEKVAAISGLDEQQKRELLDEWKARLEEFKALRAEGVIYKGVVSPFAPRLMRIARAF